VSVHFQLLFTKLFGGGKAELRLTESEDPLEAGLEIHASPPGKKLQVMSLLSGGEQALTALSLLFAVFHDQPGAICVLDEVDAPLDDLNVERFCALVKDIIADYLNSTTSVDITTPSTPIVRSHITDPNLGGFLQDIVLNGNFALAADVKFVNGIPITDLTDPTQLQARAILKFRSAMTMGWVLPRTAATSTW